MPGETIKIFCRLRPAKRSVKYNINQTFKGASIELNREKQKDLIDNTRETYFYKFDGIIDQEAKQEEVYERTAKGCVISALDGYNSTLFAYGQTGSGKTYTMTGGPMHYNERGVIPRCIHTIYEELQKRTDKEYTITISFMEIYNNYGYDLLDKSRDVKQLEDLQKVQMREDSSGNILLSNIRCLPAKSEEDALNLLFVGDNNRTMCETPQNPNSSRSHCIFTINIESRVPGSSSVTFSKLHLVDLAGSERVHKHEVSGRIFNEATNINLSLHFLEQVIVALSERREHVPYRNSLMTTVLRDSIGGNCKTIMIATINPDPEQLMESISTCRFAQRVASVTQHAVLNKRIDPYTMIKQLKKKVATLKERLAFYENGEEEKDIDANERAVVHEKVRQFIKDEDQDVINLGGDFARIREGFSYFRNIVLQKKLKIPASNPVAANAIQSTTSDEIASPITTNTSSYTDEQIKNLKLAVNLRDIEVDILVGMLSKKNKNMMESGTQTGGETSHTKAAAIDKEDLKASINAKARYERSQQDIEQKLEENRKLKQYTQAIGMVDRAQAFEHFRKSYRKNEVIERTKSKLKLKFVKAKELGVEINSLRGTIGKLKADLVRIRSLRATSQDEDEIAVLDEQDVAIVNNIKTKRDLYTEKFDGLKEVKRQIQHVQRGLEQSRIRLQKDFEDWYNTTNFNPSSPNSVSLSAPQQSSSPKASVSTFSSTDYQSIPSSINDDRQAVKQHVKPDKENVSPLFKKTNPIQKPRLTSSLLAEHQRQFSPKSISPRFSPASPPPPSKSSTYSASSNVFQSDHASPPSKKRFSRTQNQSQDQSQNQSQSISGLNPNNPLLKKLANYMRLPGASKVSSSSTSGFSLLQKSIS